MSLCEYIFFPNKVQTTFLDISIREALLPFHQALQTALPMLFLYRAISHVMVAPVLWAMALAGIYTSIPTAFSVDALAIVSPIKCGCGTNLLLG